MLNSGTSLPLGLAITAWLLTNGGIHMLWLMLKKALAQVLKYSAHCLDVSAEAQAQEKSSPSGPNLDLSDGDVS